MDMRNFAAVEVQYEFSNLERQRMFQAEPADGPYQTVVYDLNTENLNTSIEKQPDGSIILKYAYADIELDNLKTAFDLLDMFQEHINPIFHTRAIVFEVNSGDIALMFKGGRDPYIVDSNGNRKGVESIEEALFQMLSYETDDPRLSAILL